MSELHSLPPDATDQLYARVSRCYGQAVLRALFTFTTTVGGGEGDSNLAGKRDCRRATRYEFAPTPGEAERLVLAALLVLLHENGGGHKVSFMLPELLRLLDWPIDESSWNSVERALDRYMQPVHREFCLVSPLSGYGRATRVTSWRRLVSGYEYSEESEDDATGPVLNLAARRVAVTFNPDVLPRSEVMKCNPGCG